MSEADVIRERLQEALDEPWSGSEEGAGCKDASSCPVTRAAQQIVGDRTVGKVRYAAGNCRSGCWRALRHDGETLEVLKVLEWVEPVFKTAKPSPVLAIVRGLDHASGMAAVYLYNPTAESCLGYAPPELLINERWWGRRLTALRQPAGEQG